MTGEIKKEPSKASLVLRGRLPKIGQLVHIHMIKPGGQDSCGFGWIATYTNPRTEDSDVSVIGPSTQGNFTTPKLSHLPKPSGIITADNTGQPTWHWPEECSWDR